jgi:hypothetical protein
LPNCNNSSTKMQLQTSCAARAAHCALPNIQNRYYATVYVVVGCLLAPHRSPITKGWLRLTQQHAPKLASKHLTCFSITEMVQVKRHNTITITSG